MTLLSNEIETKTRERESSEGYLNPVQKANIKLDLIVDYLDRQVSQK
jgi:hypothetical protein